MTRLTIRIFVGILGLFWFLQNHIEAGYLVMILGEFFILNGQPERLAKRGTNDDSKSD